MHASRASIEDARRQSPCVRNCCLDDAQVCIGCGRALQEILTWRDVSADERTLVLERARQRREDREARRQAAERAAGRFA
jgi:uncharacterized protein